MTSTEPSFTSEAATSAVLEPLIRLSKSHMRYHRTSDADRLVLIADNPNVSKHLRNVFPNPYTLADAESWLRLVATRVPRTQFALCTNTTDEHGRAGEIIGGIGLRRGSDVHCRSWELGYWLAEPYWGRGIITEAAQRMTRWGFETLGEECQRIFASIFSDNEASKRVLEKIGFVFEGRLRATVWKDGKLSDQLMFSMIRSDWEKQLKTV